METVFKLTKLCKSIVFFLVSSWTIVVVNCQNNGAIFDFFVARKFELQFFWKAYFFRQRFFHKEPEQKWHFQKVLFWFYATKVNLISNYETGFLGSPKQLYQALSWGLRCKRSFWHGFVKKRHSRKSLCFSALWDWRLIVSDYCLWPRRDSYFTCLVELEDAKSSFLLWIWPRTTCTENKFTCRAREACMFSNVFYVHGHEIFLSSSAE